MITQFEFEFIGSSIKYMTASIHEKRSLARLYMFSDYRLLAILYNMAWQMMDNTINSYKLYD